MQWCAYMSIKVRKGMFCYHTDGPITRCAYKGGKGWLLNGGEGWWGGGGEGL